MDNDLIAALRIKDKNLSTESSEVEMQLKTLNERLTKIRAARIGIQAILAEEGATPLEGAALTNVSITPKAADIRMGIPMGPTGPVNPSAPETDRPLLVVLNDVMADGRPRTTAELAERLTAKGYSFGARSPLRVIHATLIGASQSGAFVKHGDKWQIGHSPR
jgi:hypothetical protein